VLMAQTSPNEDVSATIAAPTKHWRPTWSLI
jgi:hypothetical protein